MSSAAATSCLSCDTRASFADAAVTSQSFETETLHGTRNRNNKLSEKHVESILLMYIIPYMLFQLTVQIFPELQGLNNPNKCRMVSINRISIIGSLNVGIMIKYIMQSYHLNQYKLMLFQRIHLASIVEWYAKQAASNMRSLQSMRPMSLGNAVPRQHDAINSYPTNRTLTNQMAHVRVCLCDLIIVTKLFVRSRIVKVSYGVNKESLMKVWTNQSKSSAFH